MLIDLHMHESTYSSDSFLKLEDMVSIAKQRGLQGICITDHDSMGLKHYAEQYSKRVNFPIFVGVEFYSLQGDIVAFGLDSLPPNRIDAQPFINKVRAAGGICFSAHPFRNNNRGLGDSLLTIEGLNGIEAFNASTSYDANLEALDYCNRLALQPLGTSDCHIQGKVGLLATRLPAYAETLEDFLRIFRMGESIPVGYHQGTYIDLVKKEPSPTSHFRCTISQGLHDEMLVPALP